MKIAMIAPIVERVPPAKYGGTERVVHTLTEELVKRGHDMTLFASGDSVTNAKLVSVYPRALREVRLQNEIVWQLLSVGAAYAREEEFDIIHDHTGYIGLPAANMARTPVLLTYHGPFTLEVRRIFNTLRKPFVSTISNAQAALAPTLHHAGTVHNGLNMRHYPFSNEHDGYLLFVGRISPEKGVHIAIQVAQELALPLVIAAKLEPSDRPYYRDYIEPFLSDQIRWIGEVDETERNRLMSRAMCFLHPVTWPEPFGLTLIEAMACGAPVVAFGRGSIPEIVQNRRTGFVVRTVDEMIDAVQNIGAIDRKRCRRHALVSFGAERMADGYEAIYEKILKKGL